MAQFDRRISTDRRKGQTPALGRHTVLGRRQGFRRRSDREKGGYVDRYSSKLFFFLVLIIGLNILDVLFTMIILDRKGWEYNPVVKSVMNLYGDGFWIWKFAIVSFSLVLLCLHSKFKPVKQIIITLGAIYLLTILYQIFVLLRL